MRLVVDGSNVMGSRPDGWWRDRPAARRRLVAQTAALGDAAVRELAGCDVAVPVLVVFDGREHDVGPAGALDVRFAPDADDAIAALVEEGDVVVTSDRELRRRCAERGAPSVGAGALLRAISRSAGPAAR